MRASIRARDRASSFSSPRPGRRILRSIVIIRGVAIGGVAVATMAVVELSAEEDHGSEDGKVAQNAQDSRHYKTPSPEFPKDVIRSGEPGVDRPGLL